MPWHIESDNPECSGFAVVKDSDGEIEGCHKTRADAEAQLAALYSSEEDSAEPSGEESGAEPGGTSRSHEPPPEEIRASWPETVELREAAGSGMPTMVGHFSRFNEWARIADRSGEFMERILPGAFARTLKNNRSNIRVLFQHGRDPQVGDKPLGPIADMREDAEGAAYEVPLLDTQYNRELLPGLRAGLYGASFRFSVVQDRWDDAPKRSSHNPDALPERSIVEAKLMEFGPVTWPAYAGATAGVRSLTLSDLDAAVAPHQVTSALPDAGPEPPAAHSDEGTRETVEPPSPSSKESATVEYVTRDDKAARITELKDSLREQAVAAPGVLPPDAQARWDADTAELDALELDVAAWDERQARLKAYMADETKTVPTFSPPTFNVIRKVDDIYDLRSDDLISGDDEHRAQAWRDRAMRSVETSTIPHPKANVDGARAHVAKMLDFDDTPDKQLAKRLLVTGSPGYRKAFLNYLSGYPMEQRYAALTTGTTTTGGFATPWVLDPTIIATGAHTSTNPYRSVCRVVNLVGTNKWEALTASAVLSAYAGEAVAVVEGGPTFAQPTYNCLKAHSMVTMSYEILEDRPDIVSEVATLIQESKDTLEENYFSVGAGTTVPWGVALLSEFTTLKTVGAAAVIITDVYGLEAALPIRHRQNAVFFMSRPTIRAIQGMETVGGILFNSTIGYPAVGNAVRSPVGNTGLTLLGYPVVEAPSITSTLTTPDTNPIVFCDPSAYIIVDRVGLNMERIDNIFEHAAGSLPMGQRGLYAHWRNTARRVNVDAGRILVIE